MNNGNNGENKNKESKLEQCIEKLRESGHEVTNVTRRGAANGIVGGVRRGNSTHGQEEDTDH